MPIDPWLPRAAAMHPRRVALEAAGGELTYAQLLEAARIDAPPGSRVALALPPGLGFVVALHACLVARAAAVPVDPRLGEAEQAALIASADLVLDPGSDLAIQQTGNRNAGLQDLTPVTVVVGAEREGLPESVVAACDEVAHIPIRSESLNAGMAATVALYELDRRIRDHG